MGTEANRAVPGLAEVLGDEIVLRALEGIILPAIRRQHPSREQFLDRLALVEDLDGPAVGRP